MIKSMTGYGRAVQTFENLSLIHIFYWLSDELIALPFDQWKLTVCLERYDGRKTITEPLTVIFSGAKTKRRGEPEEDLEIERSVSDGL